MSNTKQAAPAPEQVVMQDGSEPPRIVEFAGKRKMLKESWTDADGTIKVRLDFRNGQSRVFTVPAALIAKAAAHGAEQKLGDETAGIDDVDDMVLAVDELIDRLYNGEWNAKREANGMAGTSILLKALAELYAGKKSTDELKKFLATKTHAEKIALRNNAKVKPIVERLEAEKAAKATKVDTDALLAGLDA